MARRRRVAASLTPADDNPCGLLIQVGPPIITKIKREWGAKTMTPIPFPVGTFATIDAVCVAFNIARQTVYNTLSSKRALFDKPMYRPGRLGRTYRRILSPRDLDTLRHIFRLYVKK